MALYNLVYTGDAAALQTELEAAGITVNAIYESLNVMNVTTSDSVDFSQFSQVTLTEEDTSVTATLSAWQRNRVNSTDLPMRTVYTPKNEGAGVVVYVLDSGIDITHPELHGRNILNLHSYDETFNDTIGHGTAIASLIVGGQLGAARDATIKNVKIQSGVAIPISQLLAAFNAVKTDHLETPDDVKVVNCSWHVAKSQILDEKIRELQLSGLVVVASAGNTVEAADNFSPVGLDTVIGVAASDAYDRVIGWGPGTGSNWGPEVDITAPGIDVEIAALDGTITSGSGTSYAAAITSALVCQYIHNSPGQTASQIQNNFLSAGLADRLFRNETIYGTTPNLLVQAISHDNLFLSPDPANTYIPVKRGTSITIPVQIAAPGVAVNIDDVLFGTHYRNQLPWVTYDGTELTATPPADLQVGKYRQFMEALNSDNEQLYLMVLKFGVYDVSEDEVDMTQPEVYYSKQSDGTVIVRLDACTQFCPPECSEQFKEGTCGCGGNQCSGF